MKLDSKAYSPLILRYHRLMDVFAKSDDERDFYLDKIEGFIIYVDLDKNYEEILALEKEIIKSANRFCKVPKMTFFEIKKFMEGFVQEKVYDIDTKEKLLDIISAKEARENFLEFIYDNLNELEKWQQYYQERSRVRIIEWLRLNNILFVFEEDLDFYHNIVEKVKRTLFDKKVPKEIAQTRESLFEKAKTYYSNEALNPRPKRGRPPKQAVKISIEPQFTNDIYTTVPSVARHFLYIPDITTAESVTFSAKFETEEHLLASLRGSDRIKVDEKLEALSHRLESLQNLSQKFSGSDLLSKETPPKSFRDVSRAGIKEKKEVLISPKGKHKKIDIAVQDVLPKKRDRSKKEVEDEEEFTPQKRKRFTMKKVSKIKTKKNDK
jgi:hypothetical protein